MANLNDVTDRARIEGVFAKKDPRAFAATGRPPRPANPGEMTRFIYEQFGLLAEEFDSMTVEDLWQYVGVALDRMTDSVKNAKLEKGRPIQFRSFDTPANTTNRRVEVVNDGGVFVQVMARRVGIPRQGREPQQDVWVEIAAQISDD